MALHAEDGARLQRIEAGLAVDDPALVAQFRAWRPVAGRAPVAPGWSVVPGWALLAFLVGFTTWIVAPWVGVTIVLVAVWVAGLSLWARRRATRAPVRRRR